MKMRLLAVFLALGVGLMSLSSCERIDAGHVGLKVNYYGSDKGVSDVTEVTGWQFYWPLSSTVVEFPTFTQTKDYEAFAVTAKDASTFTALFAIIILMWRPWWFYDFIDDLYKFKVRWRT